jgi:hypothetical protein
MMHRYLFVLLVALVLTPSAAAAQTLFGQKMAVGASVTMNNPSETALGDTRVTISPNFRLVPRKGLGLAWGLSWFETDRFNFQAIGGDNTEGRIRIRPVMAGASYTFGEDRTFLSVSTVAGIAFNRTRGGGGVSIDNSFAVRPGVGFWHSVHPRVGLTAFGGYVITRPDITAGGSTRSLKADYATFSVGGAVVLF